MAYEDEPKRKPIPTKHKIDAYGSYLLLLNIFLAAFVMSALSAKYIVIVAPHDMMMQGPVIQDLSNDTESPRPLVCNPHYQTFRDTYLTEEIKNYETLRSGAFQNLTEVEALRNKADQVLGRSESTFAFSVKDVCEIIPPASETGGCITYAKIEKECLGGDCGTEPNVCFWKNGKLIQYATYGQLIAYIPALLMTMGLMYDPPPAGFKRILKPLICALFYGLTAIFSVFGLLMVMSSKSKYAPALMGTEFVGFAASNGTGYLAFLLNALCFLVFTGIYLYLGIFAPKYPRQIDRWLIRRRNFETALEQMTDNAKGS